MHCVAKQLSTKMATDVKDKRHLILTLVISPSSIARVVRITPEQAQKEFAQESTKSSQAYDSDESDVNEVNELKMLTKLHDNDSR